MSQNSMFSTDVILNIGGNLSEQDFKDLVYTKLQEVLKKVFPDNREKQRIKVSPTTFQFACPFCRDSARVSSKKRGNFIFKPGPFYNCYKCFNCNSFMSISKFFKEFGENLPLSAVDYLSKNRPVAYNSNILDNNGLSEVVECMFNASEIESCAVEKDFLVRAYRLHYIDVNSRPGQYLIGRCISNFSNFLYDPMSDSLIILNCIKNKVISFQIRCITPNFKGRKYITISLKDIHEKLLKDGMVINDQLNSYSMLFNLYNINPRKPLLATEGPIDSMFLPNCIATLGASKTVNIGLPLWYVYDSDEKGRKESIKKLSKGCHVFMWEKLKREYGFPDKSKWDINDFIIWCNRYGKNVPKFWSSYFSNDSLDIMDI